MTPTGPAAKPIIRRSGPWAIGWWASCTAAWPTGSSTRSRSPADSGRSRLTSGAGGAGGCHPGDAGHLDRPEARVPTGRDAARSSAMGRPDSLAAGSGGRRRRHHPAGEFGRIPRSCLTTATVDLSRIVTSRLQRRSDWLDLITRVVHSGCDQNHLPSVMAVLSEQFPGAYTPTGGQCPVRGGRPTRSVLDVEWRTVHPTRPLSIEQ
jgi:hypothetical protein